MAELIVKKCKTCGAEKPDDQFYSAVRNSGNVTLSSACRDCHGKKERSCIQCGAKFIGKAGAKLCSPGCKKKYRPRTENKCLKCGNPFPVDRLSRKYCSSKCSNEAKIGKTIASKGKSRAHTFRAREAVCPICSGKFRATKDFGDYKQIYCSEACKAKKNPPVEIKCAYCEGIFIARKGAKKYCSRKCRDLHYRVLLKGENSPNWKGGKTKKSQCLRTSAAYAEWRSAVFERDDYTCVECGAGSMAGKHVELHADHIKPLSEFPDMALDVSNGRTLCRPCHEETDTWGWKQSLRMRNLKADNDNEPPAVVAA